MKDNSAIWGVIEQIHEIVVIAGEDGHISYANAKAHELLEFGEELNNCFLDEVFPGEFTMSGGKFSCVALKGNIIKTSAYRKNKTCFSIDLQIFEENGDYICCASDTTKSDYYEKKANQSDQEAHEAMQVKTQFVANITHELRTPVNGILGNTRELMELEDDDKKLRYLNLIERGCKDMHAIINDILDFSKLDAGKFILEDNKYDFFEMVEYIKSTHINKITEKGLQFDVNVSDGVPQFVIGDELRLQQVLNNLLSNAVKFTHTGKIGLEIYKTAQIDNKVELFFIVIDTGIGISAEGKDKLFKSFSQVEASTTRKYGGTGLGLYISKQLIELMNGNIHVDSEPGKGSMFSFHVWLGLPEDEVTAGNTMQAFNVEMPTIDTFNEKSELMEYGTKDNLNEIREKLSKLILCVDMDNWEKAENFMESIRELTANAPREVKTGVLKLKMAVQKADADKTSESYENLLSLVPKQE